MASANWRLHGGKSPARVDPFRVGLGLRRVLLKEEEQWAKKNYMVLDNAGLKLAV